MAAQAPLHAGESINTGSDLAGRSWVVPSTHEGHTMTVLGSITGSVYGTCIVRCSCGGYFRVARQNVVKALRRQEGSSDAGQA